MLLELLPHRRGGADRRVVEVGDVGRRFRRRRVEQVVEYPLAAHHRRGPGRVRRHRQDAALREDAAARRAGQIDAAEGRTGDAGDAVVPRQALVEEGIAAVDEIEDAAVFTDDRVEEHLGLAPHRQAEVVLEIRELLPVARHRLEGAELQPLAAEVFGERVRARILQHPPHLHRQHLGVAQRPGVSRPPQLRVGRAGPQEVGEPGRQFVRRNLERRDRGRRRAARRAIALDAEEEVGRDENRLQPHRQPLVERVLFLLRRPRQRDVLLHLARRHRTPERLAREAGDDARRAGAHVRAVEMAAREDLLAARRRGSLRVRVRAADVDRVHPHAVQRDLRQHLGAFVEPLARRGDPLRRRVRRLLELPGHLRPRRRVGTVVARRQALVDARDRDRQPPIAGRQPDAELDGLAAEILAIDLERRRVLLIVGPGLHFLVIDPEHDRHRHRRLRPQPAEHDANHVLAIDRDAVDGVERVGDAEAGDVVRRRHAALLDDAAAFGTQPDERRLERRRSEERLSRDPIGGGDVLLHQPRRQRQHVRDVVEAIAGVVLREIVGRLGADTEQVLDGVVVLGAVETPGGDAAGVRNGGALDALELVRQPRRDRLPIVLLGLLLFDRRHFLRPQLGDHVFPVVPLIVERRRAGERLEVQAVLLLLVAVARDAVLGDERFDEGVEARGGLRGRRRGRGFTRGLGGLLCGADRGKRGQENNDQERPHAPPCDPESEFWAERARDP